MLEIVGDSHLIALADAAQLPEMKPLLSGWENRIRLAQLGNGYDFFSPFFSVKGDAVSFTQAPALRNFRQINPDMPDAIVRDDPRRFVFMFGLYPSLGFNAEHWMTHTVAPWSGDRHFVSQSAFNTIIDHLLAQPMAFFRQLKQMNVRFSVASCCPVPASYHLLAQKTNFAAHEITLIYDRFRDHAAQRLAEMGVFCHFPPKEVYDEYGAMLDIYVKRPGDYHANPAYGRLMLAKILTEVESLD